MLFGTQFTLSLIVYALLAAWYVVPWLARKAQAEALMPLLWVHAFRVSGGIILAPGSVDAAVPDVFRQTIGYGDMTVAVLALITLVALRVRFAGAIAVVWLFIVVATLDTGNAIVQSLRFDVFSYPLGINWLIFTAYVPALLVTTVLIVVRLLRPQPAGVTRRA